MPDLSNETLIVFDVETTGLYPKGGDRIIELAAVKLNGPTIVDQFTSLVNPQRPVPYEATSVNGITDPMLKKAPLPEAVYPKLVEFIGRGYVVGHNIGFDMEFLDMELTRLSLNLDHHAGTIDTVRMAKDLYPNLPRYTLLAVAQFLDLGKEQKHRALEDVNMTAKVFLKMLGYAQKKNISSIHEIIKAYGSMNTWESKGLFA